MFWEKEIETIDKKELEKYQIQKLNETLNNCKKAPFYKKVFEKLNIEKINSFEDIKRLPFTTKQDLRDNFPYGFFNNWIGRCCKTSLFLRNNW